MKTMTATEVARNFSEVLSAIEHDHESITVTRGGKQVAVINPTPSGSGAALKALLRTHTPDDAWEDDLRSIRETALDQEREWRD